MHQCVDMNLLSLLVNRDVFKAPFVSNWINFYSKRSLLKTKRWWKSFAERPSEILFRPLSNGETVFCSCRFPISKASFEILFMTVNPLPRMSKRWKASCYIIDTHFFCWPLCSTLWNICLTSWIKIWDLSGNTVWPQNVARFALNVVCELLWYFQTLWHCFLAFAHLFCVWQF